MRWFELPGEIRQLVYKCYFEDASILIHDSDSKSHDLCVPTLPYNTRKCSSIDFLLTCKIVNVEAWPTFLHTTNFVSASCLFNILPSRKNNDGMPMSRHVPVSFLKPTETRSLFTTHETFQLHIWLHEFSGGNSGRIASPSRHSFLKIPQQQRLERLTITNTILLSWDTRSSARTLCKLLYFAARYVEVTEFKCQTYEAGYRAVADRSTITYRIILSAGTNVSVFGDDKQHVSTLMDALRLSMKEIADFYRGSFSAMRSKLKYTTVDSQGSRHEL